MNNIITLKNILFYAKYHNLNKLFAKFEDKYSTLTPIYDITVNESQKHVYLHISSKYNFIDNGKPPRYIDVYDLSKHLEIHGEYKVYILNVNFNQIRAISGFSKQVCGDMNLIYDYWPYKNDK